MKITIERQRAVCMAYLCYTDEKMGAKGDKNCEVTKKMCEDISNRMETLKPLLNEDGKSDWKIVWGPSVYTLWYAIRQDNMMFVAQQISNPSNYIVAIRGTNGDAILDWITEDFEVKKKIDWKLPEGKTVQGTPKISEATNNGISILLDKNKICPCEGLPASGQSITEFLTSIAKQKCNIMFTGHSLAGALAPTLALHFKQYQGLSDNWDPDSNATISTIPFAGATAGNKDFANYFDTLMGDSCDRIHNLNDIVPHAWQTSTLEQLPNLYSSIDIKMPSLLEDVLKKIEKDITDYEQIDTSDSFAFELSKEHDSYMKQALYQHVKSYPTVLGVPELNT